MRGLRRWIQRVGSEFGGECVGFGQCGEGVTFGRERTCAVGLG